MLNVETSKNKQYEHLDTNNNNAIKVETTDTSKSTVKNIPKIQEEQIQFKFQILDFKIYNIHTEEPNKTFIELNPTTTLEYIFKNQIFNISIPNPQDNNSLFLDELIYHKEQSISKSLHKLEILTNNPDASTLQPQFIPQIQKENKILTENAHHIGQIYKEHAYKAQSLQLKLKSKLDKQKLKDEQEAIKIESRKFNEQIKQLKQENKENRKKKIKEIDLEIKTLEKELNRQKTPILNSQISENQNITSIQSYTL
jgi:hypothetical protein